MNVDELERVLRARLGNKRQAKSASAKARAQLFAKCCEVLFENNRIRLVGGALR